MHVDVVVTAMSPAPGCKLVAFIGVVQAEPRALEVMVEVLAGPGSRDGHVHLKDYAAIPWKCVPVAVPSKGRELELCEQTLSMLRYHAYDMKCVHVFVDGELQREDHTSEYDRYYHMLRSSGFGMVGLHPGGKDLRSQYDRIFQFFQNVPELVVTTDMVPQIVIRKHMNHVNVEPLEKGMLQTIIRIGFDISKEEKARAWSLASCKAGMNLTPGTISRRCGLLCGNFHGIRMDLGPPPAMTISNFTTDVEFSLRCWDESGSIVRFLGIAASHAYRSRGGLSMNSMSPEARYEQTNKAIEKLAKKFPKLIRTERKQSRRMTRMTYSFRQIGKAPMKFFGTFETRGPKLKKGWRPLTGKQRMRDLRLRKKPAKR